GVYVGRERKVERKKVYFVADAHLGSRTLEDSSANEKLLVEWLETIKKDALEVYFLGDMLDFWFEYKHVVPKGFIRFFGKVAELADEGIAIHWFVGNHDLWMKDYFVKELKISIHKEPLSKEIMGKHFFLAHGDEFLGKYDRGYKFLRSVFHNKVMQWLFSWIHPDISIGFALWWSKSNRENPERKQVKKEYQLLSLQEYAREYVKSHSMDYLIFAHIHVLHRENLNEKSQMIVLGDCMQELNYGVFDGKKFLLKKYKE
ncbi:MAG TPA: UDP-2,3-diacylglucosamine hydrolase, partial [Porphyromonadaceae bacterium]|nr:UDP-2,3-diacylglucosamine hydrolase [Porphyromonadaceae bacterium]